MTVAKIIETYARTKEEAEGIEKMISRMMVLKKYEYLKEFKKRRTQRK